MLFERLIVLRFNSSGPRRGVGASVDTDRLRGMGPCPAIDGGGGFIAIDSPLLVEVIVCVAVEVAPEGIDGFRSNSLTGEKVRR